MELEETVVCVGELTLLLQSVNLQVDREDR